MEWILLVQTGNVGLVTNIPTAEYLSAWQVHVLGNLEIAEILRDYVASNPQKKKNKFVYSYHPGWGYRNEPRSQVSIWRMQEVL